MVFLRQCARFLKLRLLNLHLRSAKPSGLLVMVASGPLAICSCKLPQARKGARVAVNDVPRCGWRSLQTSPIVSIS